MFMNNTRPIEFWECINNLDSDILNYYWISSEGRIYSDYFKSKRLLTPSLGSSGYMEIALRTKYGTYKRCLMHRLVLLCFKYIPNYLYMQVNHINGIKTDNYEQNLEWCTPLENIHHAIETGLTPVGEDHHNTLFTNEQVIFISEMIMKQSSYDIIASSFYDRYGSVPKNMHSLIYSIHTKARWSSTTRDYIFPSYINRKEINLDEVYHICKNLDDGIRDYNTIIKNLGYDISSMECNKIQSMRTLISGIYTGKHFKHISKQFGFL